MIPSSFLDEIRVKLMPSQIIGKRVKLKKAGREWAGLCCFHSEKSASLTVNDQKGIFQCFGCGEGGDIFDFLIKAEGLTFPEAVERLAAEAGLAIPQDSEERVKAEAARLSLMEITQAASEYFQRELRSSSKALAYAEGRGLKAAEVKAFGVGYAPDARDALKSFLAGKGVSIEAQIAAGLLIAPEGGGIPFDRFRDRLMFPILDDRGRAISFGGRDLSGEAQAKYLNGPETTLFHKGACLFNWPAARQAAHDGALALMVEGYMDVLAAHHAGFAATVAPMGTALTADQLRLLWRLSDEPHLCFDGDAAGIAAARKALDVILPLLSAGRSIRFVAMPKGRDPDHVIRKEGVPAFHRAIESSVGLADMIWTKATEGRLLHEPERIAGLQRAIESTLEPIPDREVRQQFARNMRERIFALGRRPALNRSNGHSFHSASPGSMRLAHGFRAAPGLSLRDCSMLAAMAADPGTALEECETIAKARLSPEGSRIASCMIDALSSIDGVDQQSAWAAFDLAGISAAVGAAVASCQNAGIGTLTGATAAKIIKGVGQ